MDIIGFSLFSCNKMWTDGRAVRMSSSLNQLVYRIIAASIKHINMGCIGNPISDMISPKVIAMPTPKCLEHRRFTHIVSLFQ